MGLRKYWFSLRFRYTTSAVALVLFVLIAGYTAYQSANIAQQQTGQKLARHHQVGELTRQIRVHILHAYSFIDGYLLEPSHTEYKAHALHSIGLSISSAEQVLIYLESNPQIEEQQIRQLIKLLKDLKYRAQLLFDVRKDAARQYPSLEIGSTVMQPNRNAFNNATALALYELKDEGVHKNSPEMYADFIQARFLWTQLLSNFRLYLANRMGSFNEEALPTQEQAIQTMYKELQLQLDKLFKYEKSDRLGFQASAALVEMKRTSKNWYSGFEIVREIHHSDSWRMDSKIMKLEIVPIVEEMSSLLKDLEQVISSSINSDVEMLGSATKQQVNIFMWAGLLLLLFMFLIYWSTSRLVLGPIDSVVRALKSQAAGKGAELLPVVRSHETAALFDAFREMANRVQGRQEALEYQALHDALTTLPNRTLLQERISHHITICQREGSQLALLIIDLDRFKEINDTLGHHIGDRLLISIGERLRLQLRAEDTVARLGGDEFAILLPGADCPRAKSICQNLMQVISEAFTIDELQLFVNMSVGVACYPDHGDDVATLIQHADVAMYVAKQNKLGCSVYDAEKDNNSLYRLRLNSDLREALEKDQLCLHYQPVVDLDSARVSGLECLLRWKHPVHEWLSPEYIIELSEHTGLINPLTYWVVSKAMASGAQLHRLGYDLRIAINISAHNLKEPEFVTNIRSIIADSPLSADHLSFEITENAMMSNPILAIRMLKEFDEMGIHLAVDDFGTGFSSLAYLKQLPVSELKIDKSFVQQMTCNLSDETIVHSTIKLAHNLGMQVIAEGVEDRQIYDKLYEFGADKAQGYFMSRPLPLEELIRWLKEWPPAELSGLE